MKKILIADDERSIRQTFKFFLEKEGYSVTVSEDAIQAFELIKNEKFDLIITDCIMPKMSGLELLKKLRTNNNLTPVIVMTGEPTTKSQAYAFEIKASEYLSKPISKEQLIESVKKVFKF